MGLEKTADLTRRKKRGFSYFKEIYYLIMVFAGALFLQMFFNGNLGLLTGIFMIAIELVKIYDWETRKRGRKI